MLRLRLCMTVALAMVWQRRHLQAKSLTKKAQALCVGAFVL